MPAACNSYRRSCGTSAMTVVPSEANFVMIVLAGEEQATQFTARSAEAGHHRSPAQELRLAHCVRISTGTDEDIGAVSKPCEKMSKLSQSLGAAMQQLSRQTRRPSRVRNNRFSAFERHRLRRVLCRQCQAGRLLLPRRVRHETGGVSRPGDRRRAIEFLRRAAGQDPVRPHHAAPPGRPIAEHMYASTATACKRSRCGWTMPSQRTWKPQSAARAACTRRKCSATSTAKCACPPSPPTAIPSTAFVERRTTAARFCPAS